MRLLYSFSVYALLSVLFLYFFWRGLREPEYRKRWSERLGDAPSGPEGAIWIHAASVGEVQAVTPLITALLSARTDTAILVTTFTPTGSALVQRRIAQNWGRRVGHCYLPLDTPRAVRRFLKRVRPRRCLIVETELWPNMLLGCQQQGVPVDLVSATLSERSLQRYLKCPANRLFPRVMPVVRQVLAQSAEDQQRFVRLGMAADKVSVVGNLKFDYRPPQDIAEQGMRLRNHWQAAERPVWVAASTHEGEEQIVLEAFKRLRREMHDLLLLLVPRHPQRFDRSYRLCLDAGLSVARHSRKDQVDEETEVVLGDTLGDLLAFYAASDVVFVGGSLVPVGGHNLLEPAAQKRPVLSGPYTDSQAQQREALLQAGGFIEVRDTATLAQAVRQLFDAPARRAEMGKAAFSVVLANQGIVERTLKQLFPD